MQLTRLTRFITGSGDLRAFGGLGRVFALFAVLLLAVLPAVMLPTADARGSESGQPLPRFASIEARKAYARTGPAQRYPVRWVYRRANLPLEIVREYGAWRKIRDYKGGEGWMHVSLLSGTRTVLLDAQEMQILTASAAPDSRIVARMEPGSVAVLETCRGGRCLVRSGEFEGWTERKFLWGIYPHEFLN